MLGLSTEKVNQIQQKQTCICKKFTTTENQHKKLKPGLVPSYDLLPGNGTCLFWRQ